MIGYRYYDFGEQPSTKTMKFHAHIRGTGCRAFLHICLDEPDLEHKIGTCQIGIDSQLVSCITNTVPGRHALFLLVEQDYSGSLVGCFDGRNLFDLEQFVFTF